MVSSISSMHRHGFNMLKSMLFGGKIVGSWVATLGGSGFDGANSIAVAPDGAIYTCGFTESTESGVRAALLVKYNDSGSLLWQKTLGGSSSAQVESVAVAPDGFIYVGGTSDSRPILAKYSSSGTLQWYKVFEGNRNASFTSIAIDSDGHIYACGRTNSGENVLLVKYDGDGIIQWKKYIYGSGSDWGNSLAVAPDGSIYICGYTSSSDTEYSDILIIKCNSSGTLLWKRFIDSGSTDQGYSVAVAQDGRVYVCGQTGSGGYRAFLASYSSSGSLLWQKKLSTPSTSVNNSLIVAQDVTVYVCGVAASTATSKNEVHIEKYDSSGTILWQKIFSGDGDIGAQSVTVDSDGAVYVCGYAESVTSGTRDLLIIKLTSDISEGNETIQFGPFTLESSNHTESTTSFLSNSLYVYTNDASLTEISDSFDSQESFLTSTLYLES